MAVCALPLQVAKSSSGSPKSRQPRSASSSPCGNGPVQAAKLHRWVVVHVSSEGQCGQFIFDRETLLSRGVFAINGRGGKRALRVYPPWSQPAARQAVQSQKWQIECFVAMTPWEPASILRIRDLFRCV